MTIEDSRAYLNKHPELIRILLEINKIAYQLYTSQKEFEDFIRETAIEYVKLRQILGSNYEIIRN